MHILHVYKNYYPILGGIENHIRALAEAQVRRGHTVTVLVTNRGLRTVEDQLNGVRVIRAGSVGIVASTPLSPDFPRLLRALHPDITHLQSPYPLGEVAQWLAGYSTSRQENRGRRRPYIISYQADVTRPEQRAIMRLYGSLFRRVLSRAESVLATSPNYAASSPYLRHVASRVRIVPLGIDSTRFQPPDPPTTSHPPTLLFVGQMRHYKGVDDLLRALVHLPAEARLVLAGDGPKRPEWEALCAELGQRERVRFLGRVPDEALPALYQSADVFVLPSNGPAESFGTVLLEAMAAGRSCVTTEVGSGTSFVVEHGVTGLVVPPRSPEALAGALTRLVGDPVLRAQMGAAGRERVLRHFTLEHMIERVEEVYRLALQSG